MDWRTLNHLDPAIVVGIVNEKLRLECADVAELAAAYELDAEQLLLRLQRAGYHYEPRANQFHLR